MRELTMLEIEQLSNTEGCKKTAVENFLGSLHNNPDANAAMLNLMQDSRQYHWNTATVTAIRAGIKLSQEEDDMSSKKKERKNTKAEVEETINQLNRTELHHEPAQTEVVEEKQTKESKPTKEPKPTKYMLIAQYLREHSGEHTRAELLEIMEKEMNICKGTCSAFISDCKNERYRPKFVTELTERDGKLFLT